MRTERTARAVALLAALGVGAAACGTTSAAPSPISTTSTRHPAAAAAKTGASDPRVITGVGIDAIPAFFPATGPDTVKTSTYAAFQATITNKVVASCMRAQGFTPPPVAPAPPERHFADFPDVAELRTIGFGVVAQVEASQGAGATGLSPTEGMSSSEAAAFNAAEST